MNINERLATALILSSLKAVEDFINEAKDTYPAEAVILLKSIEKQINECRSALKIMDWDNVDYLFSNLGSEEVEEIIECFDEDNEEGMMAMEIIKGIIRNDMIGIRLDKVIK